MKNHPPIGRAEMEVLRYVSQHQPVSVGAVAAHFASTKGHVRTTILNVMERLRQKGHLKRKQIDGVFHYYPSVSRPELFRNLVRTFVETTLGGSVSPFVAYLAEEATLDEAEIAELKQLVRELERPRDQRR